MKKPIAKLLFYLTSLYVLYVVITELLFELGFKNLPIIEISGNFDFWILCFGGLITGVIIYRFGGVLNKVYGSVLIAVNIFIVPWLFMRAMV
ncbi:hypothetical protein [Pollutibacter soli]|uniref:hypothetical protein n=1 Tax=Pollutibacter soli TaxID=3034157 RepID=UPI003013EA46